MKELNGETKILLTGASGFVGVRVLQKYPRAVIAPPSLVRGAEKELQDFVLASKPSVIINAAAISDIRECEKNPEASYVANVKLPTTLAKAAARLGAKLISFSSDQVYTGCANAGPYREDEELPTPTNVYARHKLQAEKEVLSICPEAVLLRATWMYDMPLYHQKNRGNFLINILNGVARGEKTCFFDGVYRGITYVRQAVELLDKVAALSGGVYNYGSENSLTIYQTACALLDRLRLGGRKEELLQTVEAEYGKAPHNLWISGKKLKENGIFFDTTVEGFDRCVKDYGL